MGRNGRSQGRDVRRGQERRRWEGVNVNGKRRKEEEREGILIDGLVMMEILDRVYRDEASDTYI